MHLSAVGMAKAEETDMTEAGIGSTVWFDGSLLNTEVTDGYQQHGGRRLVVHSSSFHSLNCRCQRIFELTGFLGLYLDLSLLSSRKFKTDPDTASETSCPLVDRFKTGERNAVH